MQIKPFEISCSLNIGGVEKKAYASGTTITVGGDWQGKGKDAKWVGGEVATTSDGTPAVLSSPAQYEAFDSFPEVQKFFGGSLEKLLDYLNEARKREAWQAAYISLKTYVEGDDKQVEMLARDLMRRAEKLGKPLDKEVAYTRARTALGIE